MDHNPDFPPSTPDRQDQKRPYYPPPNEAFLVLVAALVGTMVVGYLLVNTTGKMGLFLTELLFIFPPIVYLQLKGYDIARCLRWNAVSPRVLFTAFLIGLALIVLLDEADRLMNLIFPMPEDVQEVLLDFVKLETWSDYLLIGSGAIFAAAICEESLFRGFMQVSMEAFGSVTKAVLFGALLFALAHFNPWWLVQILLLGVFLGFVSWRANSVIPAMLIHAMNNGVALFTGGALTGEGWEWYTAGNHVSPAILIFSIALIFLSVKYFLRQTESTFPSHAKTNAAPKS